MRSFLISQNLKNNYMQKLDIKKHEKILIVAPHPDDECIGAGGLLLKYHDRCSIIVLTNGAIGQGDNTRVAEAKIRKEEFINEMKYLGISDYRFLMIEDGTMLNRIDCLADYDFSDVDYIFVTGDKDGHSDHTGAFLAVKDAVLNMDKELRPVVFMYEVHKQLNDPTHWLDITENVDEKKKLIGFHSSQVKIHPYDEMAVLNARYRACQNRMPGRYLEVFREVTDLSCVENEDIRSLELKLQKQIQFYQILVKWVNSGITGKKVVDVLKEENINNVAIYGYAELGKLLYKELSCSGIEVKYIIDKDPAKKTRKKIKICIPENGDRNVDAVIVTAVFYFSEIKEELYHLGYKNVYSFGEIIDRM